MSEPASPAAVSPQKRRRTAPLAVAVRKPPVVVANLEAIYDQPVGGRVSVKAFVLAVSKKLRRVMVRAIKKPVLSVTW